METPTRMTLLRRVLTPPFVTAMCAIFLVVGGPVVEALADGPAPVAPSRPHQ